MQYPARKQSWLEFINESMGGSTIKDEAIDPHFNDLQPTPMHNRAYPINHSPHLMTLHHPNSNLYHPSGRMPSFEPPTNTTDKQSQPNELANGT